VPVLIEKNKSFVRRIAFNSSVICKIKEMWLFNLICSSLFVKLYCSLKQLWCLMHLWLMWRDGCILMIGNWKKRAVVILYYIINIIMNFVIESSGSLLNTKEGWILHSFCDSWKWQFFTTTQKRSNKWWYIQEAILP
jgi:hypothetical protein